MRHFRLAAVLRARRAAEDSAKTSAANAQAEATAAAIIVRAHEADLDQRGAPPPASAMAFSAGLCARQAMASALSDAVNTERLAEGRVKDRLTDLQAAAVRRKAIERLAERHAERLRREEERQEQDIADDLSGAAHHRGERPR